MRAAGTQRRADSRVLGLCQGSGSCGKLFALWALAMVCFLACRAAGEPQVRAYVERSTVTLRKPFLFTVEVTGDQVEDLKMPDVDGLNINKRANSTSTSIQTGFSGRRSSFVKKQELGYYAQATRLGKITIPPIMVRVDGRQLKTNPVLVTVVEGAQPRTPQRSSARQAPQPRRGDGELRWEEVCFTESSVDKRAVYQGELIQLTLSLWKLRLRDMRVGMFAGARLQYPKAQGFYVTTLEPANVVKERGGRSYEVTQYRQLLYPTTTGDLEIGSWHWEGGAEYGLGFFNTQRQNFSFDTPPISVKVRALPPPPSQFSGAVGRFSIEAELVNNQALQGVPAELVVRVKGRGNPNAIGEPEIPKIENAYVSDPKKDARVVQDAAGATIEKSFTYMITPLEAGDLTIPSIAFCYFDPSDEAYKTEQTDPLTVGIFASPEAPQRPILTAEEPGPPGAISVIGEDILPIVTDTRPLHSRRATPLALPSVFAAPVLGYCGLALFMRRKRRFAQDVGYARDYFAKAKGHKRLKGVEGAEEPSDEIYRALVGFIADKFNAEEAGMTSTDVRQLFGSSGVPEDLTERFTKILQSCERARYAGAGLAREEVSALKEAAAKGMDEFDAAVNQKGRSR